MEKLPCNVGKYNCSVCGYTRCKFNPLNPFIGDITTEIETIWKFTKAYGCCVHPQAGVFPYCAPCDDIDAICSKCIEMHDNAIISDTVVAVFKDLSERSMVGRAMEKIDEVRGTQWLYTDVVRSLRKKGLLK